MEIAIADVAIARQRPARPKRVVFNAISLSPASIAPSTTRGCRQLTEPPPGEFQPPRERYWPPNIHKSNKKWQKCNTPAASKKNLVAKGFFASTRHAVAKKNGGQGVAFALFAKSRMAREESRSLRHLLDIVEHRNARALHGREPCGLMLSISGACKFRAGDVEREAEAVLARISQQVDRICNRCFRRERLAIDVTAS